MQIPIASNQRPIERIPTASHPSLDRIGKPQHPNLVMLHKRWWLTSTKLDIYRVVNNLCIFFLFLSILYQTFSMAGLTAGVLEAILVNPFEVVKVSLQANKSK